MGYCSYIHVVGDDRVKDVTLQLIALIDENPVELHEEGVEILPNRSM